MSQADFSQQISPQLFAAFYLPVLACYSLSWLIHQKLSKDEYQQRIAKTHTAVLISAEIDPIATRPITTQGGSALFALGASYSNTVIIGLPILLLALGEQVISTVFLIVTFHSALLFFLTSAILARASCQRFNWSTFWQENLKNPLIASILSGALVNILAIELPQALNDTLILLGKPAITLALFILGASLSFYSITGKFTQLYLASFAKLLLLPIAVWCTATYLFNLAALTTTILVILSACPTGVNAYLVAKAQKQQQEVVAGTVVMTTLLSIITLPLWLSFLL